MCNNYDNDNGNDNDNNYNNTNTTNKNVFKRQLYACLSLGFCSPCITL